MTKKDDPLPFWYATARGQYREIGASQLGPGLLREIDNDMDITPQDEVDEIRRVLRKVRGVGIPKEGRGEIPPLCPLCLQRVPKTQSCQWCKTDEN